MAKEEEEELSEKGSDSEDEDTNRDSQSDGSDKESDRENDEKQGKDDEAVRIVAVCTDLNCHICMHFFFFVLA